MALLVVSQYALRGYGDRWVWVRGPVWPNHCVRLWWRWAGTEGSIVSSLICDRWLMLSSETLLEPLITDGLLLYALASHQWLCSHVPLNWTLGSTVRGAL